MEVHQLSRSEKAPVRNEPYWLGVLSERGWDGLAADEEKAVRFSVAFYLERLADYPCTVIEGKPFQVTCLPERGGLKVQLGESSWHLSHEGYLLGVVGMSGSGGAQWYALEKLGELVPQAVFKASHAEFSEDCSTCEPNYEEELPKLSIDTSYEHHASPLKLAHELVVELESYARRVAEASQEAGKALPAGSPALQILVNALKTRERLEYLTADLDEARRFSPRQLDVVREMMSRLRNGEAKQTDIERLIYVIRDAGMRKS